ncbi:conjugal transfer protein [Nocardia brasiliensis]|uniref:conjugal transfer protein n=1 Tax=Nocardia brasiliensis TaxID=37326 RepID=UPI0024569DE0|nr:conjugal transfer protein [Nocardia brasiliensis]
MRILPGKPDDSGEALLRRMVVRRQREKALIAVLAVLALLGGGHAVLSFFETEAPPDDDRAASRLIGNSYLATSFAEDFVVTYLRADARNRDSLERYVGALQQAVLPTAPGVVDDPVAVYAARTMSSGDVDIWAVTVSVHQGENAAVRSYYRVAISLIDGGVRALSLPAAVEPPRQATGLALGYGTTCGPDTAVGRAATGFLTSYLTGSGDIARYSTPGSGFVGLRPPPYSKLDSVTLATDDSTCGSGATTVHLLATVGPRTENDVAATLGYPLTMVMNGGQWQVRSIDAVPALRIPLTAADNHLPRGAPIVTPSTTPVEIPPATQK